MSPDVVDRLCGIWAVSRCRHCTRLFCEPTCPEQALCEHCVERVIFEAEGERNFDEIDGLGWWPRGCDRLVPGGRRCGAAWSHYDAQPWRSNLHTYCTEGHWHTAHASAATFWRVAEAILEVSA